MPLAGLQSPHTDHLARYFLTLFVGDRNDDAVLALLIEGRMMDRTLDAHRRDARALRFRAAGAEFQMVMAAGANIGALQDGRLAVRTYSGCAESALPSDAHNFGVPPPTTPNDALAFSSSQPNSTWPRMREPAATVIDPALTSPTITPPSWTSTRLADSILPCSSPPTTTMPANT